MLPGGIGTYNASHVDTARHDTTVSGTLSAPVTRYAEAVVPTEYGVLRMVVYRVGDSTPPEEHIALIAGDIAPGDVPVLARVHSECWTGEVMRSHKCDCRDQLDRALRRSPRQVAAWSCTCGRRAVASASATRSAPTPSSRRASTPSTPTASSASPTTRALRRRRGILRDLGVTRVALLTNNPAKVQGLANGGIVVANRLALKAEPNEHNAEYLAVKARKMGHEL